MAHDLGGQAIETLAGIMPRHRFEPMRVGTIRDLFDQFGAQQCRGAVIHLGKLRADASLKRKPPKERGAEGMDRLYLQATRRLDGTGKKPSRLLKTLGAKTFGQAKRQQLTGQFRVRQHGPFAQTLEQAVLHLARGGLGVGQAEDVLRLHVFKQQSRDPIGQNAGLAGPRIGRQPGRTPRLCGVDLPLSGGIARHGSFTFTGVSVMSHSPNRASWSYSPRSRLLSIARRAGYPVSSCK